MINIAVVGTGAWGLNLVRNFANLPEANLYACCDLDKNRLEKVKRNRPKTITTSNIDDILTDSKADGVVIATSAATHFKLAEKSLLHDKHTFVEKPLTLNVQEAEKLIQLAEEKSKILMVGHLLEYHPAVDKLKELIKSGELGDIYYLYSQRLNLGKIRQDENALWSFAPHDISVILYLLEEEPDDVSARGESYLQERIEDVVFVNLHFASGAMAQIQLSWLDPHKVRKTTIVGSKKMVVFDDMESMEKVKIYDKGITKSGAVVSYGESLTLRFGDIYIPRINMSEPLTIECQHFIDCIQENKTPKSDGKDGLRALKVLAAAQKSLDRGGMPIKCK